MDFVYVKDPPVENEFNLLEKLNLLYDHCHEMILMFDERGNVIESNGLAREQLGYGGNIYRITMEKIFPKVFRMEQGRLRILKKNEEINVETVAYRKNMTCFPVCIKVYFETYDQMRVGICTAMNISDRVTAFRDMKHALEESESTNKMKNEFLANVTHELKTPLNGMMGLTESILSTNLTGEQRNTLDIINKCCNNMKKIVDKLLDFSKMEAGKLMLEERNFDFREMVHNVVALNKGLMEDKGLKFICNIADDIPKYVVGDELRVTQILNNLLSNATKFTSIGHIALQIVKTAETPEEIELFFMVMDTGIGISEKDQDKLFKSFSQVDGSITRRFGGTGLGLAICKRLVEMMDGMITVNSEEGKGSTFSFMIQLKTFNELINQDSSVVENKSSRLNSNLDIKYLETLVRASNRKLILSVEDDSIREIKKFGTEQNRAEISRNIEKLILCLEMDNWDKAEGFITIMKELIPEDRTEIRRVLFRLELLLRKENHEDSFRYINELKKLLNEVK